MQSIVKLVAALHKRLLAGNWTIVLGEIFVNCLSGVVNMLY